LNAKEYFQKKQAEEAGAGKTDTDKAGVSNADAGNDEGGELIELDARIKQHKRGRRRLIIILTVVAAAVFFAFWFAVNRQTYDSYKVISETERTEETDGTYMWFEKLIIRYTNDGVTAMDSSQNELWQQAYEMSNPIAVEEGSSLAVADKEGNKIYVFSKDGLRGQIWTELPVQSISVSDQGIVEAIIRNDEQTKIVCYDLKGNKLVEAKASLNNTGYPIAAAISKDGKRMLVSYVKISDKISDRVICYNFSTSGQTEAEMKVMDEEYDGILIPTVFFTDDSTAVAAAGDRLIIYKGSDRLEKSSEVAMDRQIKSLLWNDKGIELVLRNTEGDYKYTLKSYSLSGREVSSKDFNEEYSSISLEGNRVILLNDMQCTVYTTRGHKVFSGEFDTSLINVMPMPGINKFLVIRNNTIQTIRLTK